MRGPGGRGPARARRGCLGAMLGVLLGLTAGLGAGVEAQAQPRAMAAGAEATGEAVVLRVGWRAGQTVRYRVETAETLEGASTGRASSAVVSVQTVSVGADGAAAQRLRVESVRLGAGTVTEGAGGAVVQGLRAAEVRFRQDDRGAVTDTALVGVAEADRARVGALVASLQQLGPTLPVGPLRVGDTWRPRPASGSFRARAARCPSTFGDGTPCGRCGAATGPGWRTSTPWPPRASPTGTPWGRFRCGPRARRRGAFGTTSGARWCSTAASRAPSPWS